MNVSERSAFTDTERGQLRLLPGGSRRRDWQLDERTREVGKRGIAEARETLRHAKPPQPKQAAPVRKAS